MSGSPLNFFNVNTDKLCPPDGYECLATNRASKLCYFLLRNSENKNGTKWGPMSKKRNDGRERNKEKTTTTKNKERLIEAANNQADATFSGSSQVAAVFTRQFSVTDRSLEREDVRVFFFFFFPFANFFFFVCVCVLCFGVDESFCFSSCFLSNNPKKNTPYVFRSKSSATALLFEILRVFMDTAVCLQNSSQKV